jgi:hypothetical protein
VIIRTYACEDCKEIFEVELDDGSAPDPPCPYCAVELQWRPGMFSIGNSNMSKATAVAQDILEKDYGLTNFKDDAREGEASFIAPVKTTAEREAEAQAFAEIEREAKKAAHPAIHPLVAQGGFWGGAPQGPPPMVAQTLLAGARAGASQSPDPIKALHASIKASKLPAGYRIIGRA